MAHIGLKCKQTKNINMKQLLSLFLFLVPCLAWSQYPSNGNQKITLGEQTTADGLIYRGVAATDTVRKPSIDTMAYMVLDTTTNIMWHYKKATSNAWLRLNLLPSDTASIAYVNTYGTQTVNGAKTFTSAVTATRFDPTANTVTGTGMYLPAANTLGFSISGTQKMNLVSNGVGYGTDLFPWISGLSFTLDFPQFAISSGANGGGLLMSNFYINSSNQRIYKTTNGANFINTQAGAIALSTAPSGTINTVATFNPISLYLENDGRVAIGSTTLQTNYKLTIQDSVYVGGNVSASAYTTRSDYNLKDDIFDIKYGLNDVLQLQPVEYTYKSNGSKQLGFIAQDIGVILPEVVSFEESMSVNYQAIIPILTKAIQEQNLLIKALEQRIINLENK
jgi:hypothetical protein